MATHNETKAAQGDLRPHLPSKVFESEGGFLEAWSGHDYEMMKEAHVTAAKLTLHSRGFAIPRYTDSNQVCYILKGEGVLGVVFPESCEKECLTKVRVGDAVVLPMGSFHWWFNKFSEDLCILSLCDTSEAHMNGELTNFHLMGGGNGMMSGFTRDFISQAWDMEEASVEKLLGSQKGDCIVKLEEGVAMPEPPLEAVLEAPPPYGRFVYNCEEAEKDVCVKDGGLVAVLSTDKMPILKGMGLGADLVKLHPGAMCSPGFSADGAYQVTYVARGSGRVQVVGKEGERVVDCEVSAGQLFIVPRFHVVSKRAFKDGLEWFSIITKSDPVFSHLAGKTSVWKALSAEVVCAAFHVDPQLESQFRSRRTQDAIFFPPLKK